MRRGFKTEANRTSRELRVELGLHPAAPLCPFRLAAHLGITLLRLSDFAAEHPEAVTYLSSDAGARDFSAMTLCGTKPCAIIYNDSHSPGRIAADIAHELAHSLLMHEPHRLVDAGGRRHFDGELEEEANWFGPAILVSDEAAVLIASRGWSLSEAATRYGVSEPLMRMRLNTTGAYKRVSRAA